MLFYRVFELAVTHARVRDLVADLQPKSVPPKSPLSGSWDLRWEVSPAGGR